MRKILLIILVLFNFLLVKAENKLVAYYPFTENTNDVSGNGNNGTPYGVTLTTDRCGKANSAYHFNGSSYIALPTKDFINSNYTYAMWVSFDNLNSVASLFNVGAKGGDQGIQVVPNGAGWAGGGYNTNGTLTGTIPGKYPSANRWYHVILTRNDSIAKLYIDGQLEATGSTNNSSPSYASAPYYAMLGVRGFENAQYLTGKLDDVRIYNYALSTDEVAELYNSYECNKLVAYYPFTGNVNDASGNDNDGTSFGATLTTDRCGKANSAYHFNGSSYIALPTKDFINSNYTYAMWVSFDNLNSVASLLNIGAKGGDQGIQVVPNGAGWAGGGYNTNGTLTGTIPGKYPSANRWYHVILTRNDSTAKLYIDGKLEATGSTNSSSPSYASAPYYAMLGVRGFENAQYLTGKLDEVRIYNYALNTAEITELYNSYECNSNKLVAYYPFTGNVNDASGNGNDGTSFGATLTTDRCGKANNAYHFNGSSYVALPTKDFINSNYTYAMWVSFDNLNSVASLLNIGAKGGDQAIQVVHNGSGWAGGGYNTNGTLTGAIPGKYPSANRWYHVILTRNDSTARLYIDGELEATGSTNNSSPSYASAPYYAMLGVRGFEYAQFLTGKLDEVRIYNYALSTAEITELYNSYECNSNKLVAYYPFTGNVNDASGNGNDGTPYGATLTTDRCGKANSAYHFNGSSYIALPTKDFINSNYTYAMWVSFDNLNTIATLLTGAITGKYPSANKWYHVVLTGDDSGANFYIDGRLEASGSFNNLSSSYASILYYAIIGAIDFDYMQFLNGRLDELRIYNYSFSAAEVKDLYNSYSCNGNIITSINGQSLGENLFEVYPNPADGKFFVKYDKNGLTASKITVTNAIGKIVCSIEDAEAMQNSEIQLSDQPSGIYFVSIKTVEGATITKRLLLR